MLRIGTFWMLFKRALGGWWSDNVPRLGASLAYYTLFSIAPVLLVAIAIAGFVFGANAVRGEVVAQLRDLVGEQGARTVQSLLESANRPAAGVFATVVGVITFILTSTGAFLELQAALNNIWRVQPKANVNVKDFLLTRLKGLALVVGVGFLLLVSLVVSAGLAALGNYIGGFMPGWVITANVLNVLVSLGAITLLFAMVYKVLPDVKLGWRDVWVGAGTTAALFTLGKFVIGFYLGRAGATSTYGAAGSVIVVLLWVYYASQIVLLGAEFTRVWTEWHGRRAPPEDFAKRQPAAVGGDASMTTPGRGPVSSALPAKLMPGGMRE
jgi:membrane protein